MSEHKGPTTTSDASVSALGVNAWLVEENYQEYLANPSSVSPAWREYFAGETTQPTINIQADASMGATGAPPTIATPVAAQTNGSNPPGAKIPRNASNGAPQLNGSNGSNGSVASLDTAPLKASSANEEATPLRGAAARIVENMVASLAVPTATSVHPIPAKVLEVNRATINDHLAASGRKISFTHIIAFAVIRAIDVNPAMNSTFVEDVDGKGTPGVVRHSSIGLGIAIDIERSSGRSLLVPAIKDAGSYDFAGFVAAYEELITKARNGKLSVEDFSGVTLTITNPGTLGTTQSVPRLMQGQGAIIGMGALDFPVEYRATDPGTLASLGVGKVVTLTSTYDHRIIQGAESGLFLKVVDELLVGQRGFYEEIFHSLGLAVAPTRLTRDTSSTSDKSRVEPSAERQLAVASLIRAYRTYGHRIADLNPIADSVASPVEELDPSRYGLSPWDLDREFLCPDMGIGPRARLQEILTTLRRSYCGTLAVEYLHIQDEEILEWLKDRIESPSAALAGDEQRYVLRRLNESETFESFLHSRYIGQKRFGLEGGTSLIPFLDAALEVSAEKGTAEVVLGMSHRGRLNVLANVVGKPMRDIFGDFEQNADLFSVEGSGDVKYHKGASGTWRGRNGAQLPVSLVPNPSHLEAVDSVAEGIARAKEDCQAKDVLTIIMHGDASFAGQGVVFETLNLSQLPAYAIGGAVHVVINNQIGFTTPPSSARSTLYATDVAKGVGAPVIHVNGDDPEAVVRAARLCIDYRARFARDIVVDIVCYRTHGHNEGDDPSYTQPTMYRKIAEHEAVHSSYAARLVSSGVISTEEVQRDIEAITARLTSDLEATRALPVPHLERLPEPGVAAVMPLRKDTGVDLSLLSAIGGELIKRPSGFRVHPKLARQFEQRDELLSSGEVDWATGEALAFGSIMLQGRNIRLVGQDARRGTFSHRHSVLVDYDDGHEYAPLSGLSDRWSEAGSFAVYDSLLSEYAALGFEYGYSVESPETLVIWEAQFGDFANGAQIVIDNFIVAALEKWDQSSGLVMLLPHGYEGQGPEHSSARLERYLASAVGNNLTIAQPTTTAQYFHLLRAQAFSGQRRPLIVMSPKYLLRARPARSRLEDLALASFQEVIDDPTAVAVDTFDVERVVLCSGKIAYEALDRREARRSAGIESPRCAIVRVEQLFPWPQEQLTAVLQRYPSAKEIVWLQDEPANMGSWTFVAERLRDGLSSRLSLRRVSRMPSASPATGSHILHDLEVEYLLDEAVGSAPRA